MYTYLRNVDSLLTIDSSQIEKTKVEEEQESSHQHSGFVVGLSSLYLTLDQVLWCSLVHYCGLFYWSFID